MPQPNIVILDTPEAVHVRAAEEIAHWAGDAVCTHGEFTLCLAGGSTPAPAYELLATRFRLSIDWRDVQFFWGDERCVGPGDPASNFAMARRTMLEPLSIKPAQIHRIHGEEQPDAAAAAYEDELRRAFSLEPGPVPVFDLMLLGLGQNAHIASLFPSSPALREERRLAVAVDVDDRLAHRITVTPPVINRAAHVILMVCGEGKALAVHDVLEGPRDPGRLPAQIVAPSEGDVLWLLDRAAASGLRSSAATGGSDG